VLATAVVYLTGGVESPFTFTFSIAVIAAAIVLDQRGAFAAAVASTLAFSILLMLGRLGVLHPPGIAGAISTGRLAFLWVTNTLAQFLIAALASFLSRQLTAAGGALREREADLRSLAEIQEQILAAMPSGLVTGDVEGRITFVNRAGRSILGLRPEGRLEGQLDDIFPGIRSLRADAKRHELVLETPAGERTLGLAVARLHGVQGGTLIVFQDLTDLRRAEGELRRMDQLAALGAFSAQLAHEVRNPLAAMRGAAQLLAQEENEGEVRERLTTILVREADRLSVLVDNFLRFARPPEPQKERTHLVSLVLEVLEMVRLDAASEGVRLESALDPVEAWVDPGQLKQVLLNLLRNALVAARPAGVIRVEVRAQEAQARIRVWDSAGSISEENLGRIFQPFFTTKEGGTGLGLSTAHSIVRAHQGQIHVSSSPAKGTEFVVELPLGEALRASAGRR
jgi:two-component system sensor histidine kinase PilS (NtrC family)